MPKEYIERGALIEKSTYMFDEALGRCKCVLVEDVDKIPTTDVVEVVRCKDCKHFLNDTDYCKEYNKGYCEWDNTIKSKSHFCSCGKRKEGAEE